MKSKFKKNIILISLILLLLKTCLLAEEITPDRILQNTDMVRGPGKSCLVKTNVVQYKNDKKFQTGKIDVFIKGSNGNNYKSLARFLFPKYNKNRMILYTKDGVWLYVPGTKRVIRLSLSQRLLGEASNGDLLSINFQNDYNVKLEGTEIKEGKKCYRLFLTAKSTSSAYASLRYWVTVSDFYPWVCEYNALSGKVLKTAYFKSFKDMLGRLRPGQVEIRDAVKQSYKTIIYYTDMLYKDLPDKYFQKDYIPYIRWR